MPRNDNDRLLFTDLETTGTDEENDVILEVACVITDKDLNELAVYEALIWRPEARHVDGRSARLFLVRRTQGRLL